MNWLVQWVVLVGMGGWVVASTAGMAAAAQSRPGFEALAPVAADRLRISEHLARVEGELRARDSSSLTATQRLRRGNALDVLHAYWQRGVFPRNTAHPGERRPYFIDHEGRACAVAHLVIESGHRELAERVDARLHNAYVREMDEPMLLAWAEEHGFTADELALIQPSYCRCGDDGSLGGGGDGGSPAEQPYTPVCGANGLTYWNECAANLCGSIEVVHTGECEYQSRCEICGVGDRLPIVSECGRAAVCEMTGGDADQVAVPLHVAEFWLERQLDSCSTDAEYPSPWHSAEFAELELWKECIQPTAGGAGGAGGAAGAASAPSGGASPLPPATGGTAGPRAAASGQSGSGCSVASAPGSAQHHLAALLLALFALRGRLGKKREMR